ncbi:MAG TPA: heparinase II/III family protein, partial [Candidatus Krumholzibacteria bacterium]|nr:heparinase II/III family protein [Candidatus Krumholzibacteria bacterium]
ELAARIYALIDSWCVANPYLVGINWASPMDIGTRVAAWSQSLAALTDAATPSEEVCARIVRSVIRQVEHLASHMSQWPVPNNHLIGEAASLFVCGAYWPLWKDSKHWMEKGESVLAAEAERQILADGVQYEGSINYHAYALDFFLFYLHAKALRAEVPHPVVLDRTRLMATACIELVFTSGRRPRIGDDTIDRFFVLDHALDTPPLVTDESAFRDAVRPAYARLFDSTDWGRELLNIRVPTRHARHFAQAGLSIARDHAAGLAFVHGPQHRHLFSHGHLHADAGSFELEMDDNTLFIDAGTYVYFADREAREYFKSGRAHNAPLVDDVEPMQSLEPFRWESVAVGEYLGFGAAADAVAVGNRRKLHGAGGAPLEHIRTVVLTRGTALVIDAIRTPVDAVSPQTHLARIGFKTATPQGTAAIEGTQVSLTDPRRFARIVEAFSNQRIQVELIDSAADRACWYSPQYGDLKRGVAVRVNAEFESSVVVVSAVRNVDVSVVPVRLDQREAEIAIEAHGERRVTRVCFDPFSVVVGGVTVAGRGADWSTTASEGARDDRHETPAWLDELTLGS